MARRKSSDWPRAISSQSSSSDAGSSGADGMPVSKTAAARKYITEHPEAKTYAEIIEGVKSLYNFDLKNGDVSNARAFLRKSGGVTGLRKIKRRQKRGSLKVAARQTGRVASAKPAAAAAGGDVVSATLDLVAAVGLEQARAIIAGLGK